MSSSIRSRLSSARLPTLGEIRAERARRAAERERERLSRDGEAIRARCVTLAGFVREAWPVLEPNTPLIWNWHLDALCQHLEAITWRRMTPRLLANVPPGSSKSLIVAVMWQAWEWGPCALRAMRYLATAFNDGPVKRDTRKCRDLILSEWYQSLWPEVVLTRTGETSFANSGTGTREGVAFGSLTSQRGDRLIIDDPHSTETAESVAERQATTRKFREGALNRLNDQERSAIVVIMQRLHEEDVAGTILKFGMGFVHLCLPMEFEPERRCSTSIGFTDPRAEEGELLDPARFPRATVEQLRRDMGSYAWAGQYQQRPTPREGGLFKRAWFAGKIIRQAPAGTKWVRHWDLAATAAKRKVSGQAATAGVKIGRAPDGSFIVGHVVRVLEEGADVRRTIKATAEADGKTVAISLPQDPGQAGKVQAADMVKMLAGWNVHAEPESGDKVTRAEPFSAQCEAGNVYLVEGAWNDAYLDELCLFPGGSNKDQVDASSGAFGQLIQKNRYGMLGVV
ncbi:phage terminase large subunit [Rhodoplanes serenus]|uniref:phage terminase large subunit n=1 Tax=Rhodoplanes serenus TaxID=200615 RepID=UPI001AEC74B0|nr:phage terminase large subunit [Rhodoplanes serenus]